MFMYKTSTNDNLLSLERVSYNMAMSLDIDVSFDSDSEDESELEWSPMPKRRKDDIVLEVAGMYVCIRNYLTVMFTASTSNSS